MTPAELAVEAAALAPSGEVVRYGDPGLTWGPRVRPRLSALDRAAELEARLRALGDAHPGIRVHSDGVCLVNRGRRRGGVGPTHRGGAGSRSTGDDRVYTALVVHVAGEVDGFVVLLPMEPV